MHQQNDITATLSKKDKGASEVRTVLARLTRTILRDLNIGPQRFNTLMKGYLANPINGIPQNTKDRSSAQGNLTKALLREQVTWKTIEKLLILLRTTGFRLSVDLKRHGETEWTNHTLNYEHFSAGYDDEAVLEAAKQFERVWYITNTVTEETHITDESTELVRRLELNDRELNDLLETSERGETYTKGDYVVCRKDN